MKSKVDFYLPSWESRCEADAIPLSDSRARIHEGLSDDLYLEKGSRLSLSCSVSDPSAPPSYVYWDGMPPFDSR